MNADEAAAREERVNETIADYLDAVAAGRASPPDEFIAQHPDIADELKAFFRDREQFQRFAGPVAHAAPAPARQDVNSEPAKESDGTDRTARTLAPRGNAPAAAGLGTIRYFGDYELIEEIARGGMGVVYRAEQTSLKRTVALKMILAGQLAGADDVRRFHAEAEAAAKLDHPGIVPIFEVGQHEGQHYFSMGFVEGESLAHRVLKGVLPPRDAAEMTLKIAQAISYAHVEGVVHRDLKPANVLIDKDGQPRVTDFGLAKRVRTDGAESRGVSQLTATGAVLGTPSYMPPEQAAGRTKEIGPLSDVYSLGAILYCLLTGRPPFQAASPLDTLLQVLEQEPVSPRQLNRTVPRDLETISLKCLQKEPRKRFASAQELVDELQRFLNGEPIHARPVGNAERFWRWCRRNPRVAGLSAAVLLLLVTVTIGSTIAAIRIAAARDREATARRDATEQRVAAERERGIAEQERDNTSRHLYIANIHLAQQAWETGRVGRVRQLLDQHVPQTGQAELRGWEWYYLRSLCHRELLSLRVGVGVVQSVAWSLDGKRLITTIPTLRQPVEDAGITAWDTTVTVWDTSTSKEILSFSATSGEVGLTPGFDNAKAVFVGPDERRVALVTWKTAPNSEGTVTLWDLATRKGASRFNVGPLTMAGTAGSFFFSSNGQRLATISGDGIVKVWDMQTGENLTTFENRLRLPGQLTKSPVFPVLALAWSPDGQRLAVHGPLQIQIIEAATGREISTIRMDTKRDPSQSVIGALAWSPDGTRLAGAPAAMSPASTARIWNVATGEESLTVQTGGVSSLAWSPDSRSLASVGRDNMIKIWDAGDGHQLRTLRGHTAGVLSLAWNPDGRQLASGSQDGEVKIWDSARDQEVVQVPAEGGMFPYVTWRPNSQQAAYLAKNHDVSIVDFATSQTTATLPRPAAGWPGHSLAWDPDGKRLAIPHGDSVKVMDAATWQESLVLRGHSGSVDRLAWSRDGTRIASSSIRTGQGEQSIESDKSIKIWDTTSGKELRSLPGTGLTYPFDWAEGDRLVITSTRAIELWDTSSGQQIYSVPVSGMTRALTTSPDGKLIALGSTEFGGEFQATTFQVEIRESATGTLIRSMRGLTDVVRSIAWSPDGQRLATATGITEQKVQIWDVATGQEVFTLPGAGSSVAWRSDGRRLASVAPGGDLRFYDATAGYELAR